MSAEKFYALFDKPAFSVPATTSAAAASPDDPGVSAYVATVCAGVTTAARGTGNEVLNDAAYTLGRLIPGGQLTVEQATKALTDASNARGGRSDVETRTTINSGLTGGANPRTLPASNGLPTLTRILGTAQTPMVADRRPRITWANTIEAVPVVWAWEEDGQGRIPAGSLGISAGREGTGKSSFEIWKTARITKGTLPGAYHGTPRNVFYVAVEDSWKHTIVPRLMAAGADLTKVGRFDVVNVNDDEIMLSLPHDNAMLEEAIVKHNVALVVIDPLLSVIGEGINTHQSREVRSALDPLAKIADRTNSMISGIAHFNKGTGTDASSLITGSGAFKDVPRTVFGFVRDDNDGTRIMTQTKNTLAPEGPSLSYVIEQAEVDTKHGPAVTSRFVFTGESERSVHDVLRDARSGDPDEPGERDDAAEWLTGYLKKHGGEAKAADIFRAAKADQIAERTLQRARKRVGVTSTRTGFGEGATWTLPPFAPLSRHSRLPSDPGANGADGGGNAVPDSEGSEIS